MARNLYSADIFVEKSKDYENHLFFMESDEKAIIEAKQLFNDTYNHRGNYLALSRIQEHPGSVIPDYIIIFNNSNKGRLALTHEQRIAVKAIYDALEKAQGLGVHFVESPNHNIFAFNGDNVEEWDSATLDDDKNNVSFNDLTFVGPTLQDQTARGDELYIKFKD